MKKFLSVCAILAVSTSLFVGCGDDDSTNNTTEPTTSIEDVRNGSINDKEDTNELESKNTDEDENESESESESESEENEDESISEDNSNTDMNSADDSDEQIQIIRETTAQ